VQVAPRWTAPSGTLGELVVAAGARAAALAPQRSDLEGIIRGLPPVPDFAAALRRDRVAVVAEVKRRSPSRGDINPGLRAADLAAAYADGGAAAISVLTESRRFGGCAADLSAARARVTIPVLRKDFLVAQIQLVEARALGASAALLIVRALDQPQLADLVAAARALGLEPLVEIHSEAEADRAQAAGARVIGVNNRDLESLEVDPSVATRLIPHLPRSIVAVAESGIGCRADVERAARAGADAVLIGSAVSGAPDPAAAVRALSGVPREASAREAA
jgi:indole-3-glycerol phosphate synthase